MEYFSVDDLNGHKLLGLDAALSCVVRETLYAKADLAMATALVDAPKGDLMFKSLFCVRVAVFETLHHYFEKYLEEPLPHDVELVEKLKGKIEDKKKGTPKGGYTTKRVILLLLAHFKRILINDKHAEAMGFKNPGVIKDLTASLLASAVRKFIPIKVIIPDTNPRDNKYERTEN